MDPNLCALLGIAALYAAFWMASRAIDRRRGL